jgi:glycogen debranching enzyme
MCSTSDHTTLCRVDCIEDREVTQEVTLFVNSSFTPGSIVVFQTGLPSRVAERLEKLNAILEDEEELRTAFSQLDLLALNVLLYRCEEEERASIGQGVYHLPGHGTLTFAGLAGLFPLLDQLREKDDLGHPLFDNLRAGDWLLEFITNRLQQYATSSIIVPYSSLLSLFEWIQQCFEHVKQLPRYLVPKYFDIVIMKTYQTAVDRVVQLMSSFIQQSEDRGLIRRLALTSVQLFCDVPDAPLTSSYRNPETKVYFFSSLLASLPFFLPFPFFLLCFCRRVTLLL